VLLKKFNNLPYHIIEQEFLVKINLQLISIKQLNILYVTQDLQHHVCTYMHVVLIMLAIYLKSVIQMAK
jgi:hypothetical protein